ncbi:MAG: hypothetical protein K8I82_02170, partial [Anaerolineae bacterium]|nr:hypothetical protein [Anaerolineae bacterium]
MAVVPKNWFDSRQGRVLLENLTAYLFILPAGAIIFIFGLFPVAFAFFVSLYRWRRFPDEYLGLENYFEALGSFGYVLFFFISLGTFFYVGYLFYQMGRRAGWDGRAWSYLIPGAANAVASALFINWFFKVLPVVLEVPRRMPRGQARDRSVFLDEFFNSFEFEGIPEAGSRMLIGIMAGLVLSLVFLWLFRLKNRLDLLIRFTMIGLLVIGGVWLMRLTLAEIDDAIQTAESTGEDLPIWSQVIFIGLGVIFLAAAYFVWTKAVAQFNDRRFILLGLTALLLMAGGYLLIVYF